MLGGGTYQFGSFAKMEAKAVEGAKFAGWYENGELLSTDAEYRVCVREDRHLTAKFKNNTVTDLPKVKLLKVTKGKKSFTAKWKKPTKKNRVIHVSKWSKAKKVRVK